MGDCVTPEQYLAIERKAESRSEYYQGEMYAMSGAQAPHVLAVGNLAALLIPALRGRCSVFINDMRVLVSPTGLYTYPDLAVVCGKPEFADQEFREHLAVIRLVRIRLAKPGVKNETGATACRR